MPRICSTSCCVAAPSRKASRAGSAVGVDTDLAAHIDATARAAGS